MASEQCCGRLKGRLVHEEGNLAKLARQASSRASKGLLVDDAFKARLADAKVAVAQVKQAIEDHEAEHAGTPEAVA